MNLRLPRGSAPFLVVAAALVPAVLTALPGRAELAAARSAAKTATPAEEACDHPDGHAHDGAEDGAVTQCAHEAARRMMHGAPGTDAPGDRALYLMELAERAGATFLGAPPDPKAERADGAYLFHIAVLEAEGSFAALHALLKAVETGERIAVVETVQIKRRNSDRPQVRLFARLRFVERVASQADASLTRLAEDREHRHAASPEGEGR
jgi:hypothetical protein